MFTAAGSAPVQLDEPDVCLEALEDALAQGLADIVKPMAQFTAKDWVSREALEDCGRVSMDEAGNN